MGLRSELSRTLTPPLNTHTDQASSVPPALGDPETIQIQAGEEGAMSHFGGVGGHIGREHNDDHAVIIMHKLLSFRIHSGSFLLVKFRSGGFQKLIKPWILPESIVLV